MDMFTNLTKKEKLVKVIPTERGMVRTLSKRSLKRLIYLVVITNTMITLFSSGVQSDGIDGFQLDLDQLGKMNSVEIFPKYAEFLENKYKDMGIQILEFRYEVKRAEDSLIIPPEILEGKILFSKRDKELTVRVYEDSKAKIKIVLYNSK